MGVSKENLLISYEDNSDESPDDRHYVADRISDSITYRGNRAADGRLGGSKRGGIGTRAGTATKGRLDINVRLSSHR